MQLKALFGCDFHKQDLLYLFEGIYILIGNLFGWKNLKGRGILWNKGEVFMNKRLGERFEGYGHWVLELGFYL